MMRGKVFLTVAGLVLAAAGLAFFNLGQTPPKTGAQVTGGYTTHWEATELYQLEMRNRSTNVRANSIAIGVYKWVVNGSFTNGPTFTETWTGPDPTSAKLTNHSEFGEPFCRTNGYERSLWLLGHMCFTNGSHTNTGLDIMLKSAPSSSVYFEGPQGYSGGAASCFFGVLENFLGDCIATTGAYGFSYYEQPNGNGGADTVHWTGLMMPLQWTVVGTVN